jgi:hypothetical protein
MCATDFFSSTPEVIGYRLTNDEIDRANDEDDGTYE